MTKKKHRLRRWVQNTVFILGASSFGFGLGSFFVMGSLTALLGPLGRDGWGAAHIWLLLMACGALVGAVVGFVFALTSVLNHDLKLWSLIDWLAALLAVVVGVMVTQRALGQGNSIYKTMWLTTLVPLFAIGGRLMVILVHMLSVGGIPKKKRKAAPSQRSEW